MMSSQAEPQHDESSRPVILQPSHVNGDDEEAVPISEFAQKLFQRDKDKKKVSFQKAVPDPPEEENEATAVDQDEENDDVATQADLAASSECERRPRRVRKKVRFLGFNEVFFTSTPANKLHPFNPNPVPPPPPPPPPPGFFDKKPEQIYRNDLPPPPPHPPQLSSRQAPPPPPPPPPPTESLLSSPPLLAPPRPTPVLESPPLRQPIFFQPPANEGDSYINRAAFRLYTKFMDEVAEFVEIQGNVIKKRVEVQERRVVLTHHRGHIRRCDTALFDHIRKSMDNQDSNQDADLKELFDAAQKARDKVVPLEDHYEALEVELGAAEYVLQEKYGRLELRFENFFKLHGTSLSTARAPSEFSFESESSVRAEGAREQEDSRQSLLNGAVVGNQVKIGQEPITLGGSKEPRRPLTTLRNAEIRGMTLKDMTLKAPTQLITKPGSSRGSTDALEFLRKQVSSVEESMARDDEEAIGLTREQRMSESLRGIGELTSFDISIVPDSLHETRDTLLSFESRAQILDDPMLSGGESLLLRSSDAETQSTISDYLMKFDSTRDRVNRWLLHQLRISPKEIFELQRQVRCRNHDVPDWANLALQMWDRDTARYSSTYTLTSEDESEANTKKSPVPRPYPGTLQDQPYSQSLGSSRQNQADVLYFHKGAVVPLEKSQVR